MADGKKKTGEDLWDEPQISASQQSAPVIMDTPFNQVYKKLFVTGGRELEMLTRATKPMSDALMAGYSMEYQFESRYLSGKTDQLMRLAVSMGGKGREESLESLRAGSGVPEAYYESQFGNVKAYTIEE